MNPDCTFRELECFTAVAEELSFTRAALRLHLAQPPLSRHIRFLEEKLGTPLFERRPRAVALTPAGRRFYEETRGLLPQLARAGDLARRSASGESGRLRIGFVSAVAGTGLVEALRGFRETNPALQLILHDLPPARQLTLLAQGRLDAGFVGLMPLEHPQGLRFVPWSREPLRAFVPSGHRFAGRSSLRLAELKDEPFVAVAHEAAPAFSVLAHQLCREAGFRPRVVLESPRAQAVGIMVAGGSGVALLPASLANFLGTAAIAIKVHGAPDITHVAAFSEATFSGPLRQLAEMLGKGLPRARAGRKAAGQP